MNNLQKSKLFEIFQDEILNDEYTRARGPFIFAVYDSDSSKKIVIKCMSKDEMVMFYVIDYEQQQYLSECYGINGDDKEFSLNCEMESYPPKIFYRPNNDLTAEFNSMFNT